MENLVGLNVTLYISSDFIIKGKLSSHQPGLYQVTGKDQHFVFWEYEIQGIINTNLYHDLYFIN